MSHNVLRTCEAHKDFGEGYGEAPKGLGGWAGVAEPFINPPSPQSRPVNVTSLSHIRDLACPFTGPAPQGPARFIDRTLNRYSPSG